jgi:16S rRNA (guanine1516-N2)-methyltransferase
VSELLAVVVVFERSAGPRELELACHLNIELVEEDTLLNYEVQFYLKYLPEGLSLCECGKNAAGPTRVDFYDAGLTLRASDSIKQQNLIKALGLKKHPSTRILDGMAGLGKDAFLMACVGCSVQMLEKSLIIHALLKDGLERLSVGMGGVSNPSLELQQADFLSCAYSKQDFDIVYLDPMYPIAGRKSRAKKDMDRLHDLVGIDTQEQKQLDKALSIAGRRVIIKRPKNAPDFAAKKPDISYRGSSSRFDVYLTI